MHAPLLCVLLAAQCGPIAEVDNSQWIPGSLEDGGGLDAAFRLPASEETYVYILSNVLSGQPWSQETHGSDDGGDGTKGRPYLSFPEATRRTGLKFVEGKRVVYMLGCGQLYVDTGTPDGGMYDHLARQPALDPWDDNCHEMRQYSVRSIQVGGSEAHWNSWSVRGPRKMRRIGDQPTITDFTYERDADGVTPVGRMKLRYVNNASGSYANNGVKGLYLRITRDAGREVETTHPVQITGSHADSVGSSSGYLNADHGNYYHGQGVYDRDLDRFEIVSRGVEFIPSTIPVPGDVAGADAIAITGFGAYDVHNRLSYVPGHNEGKNPFPTFERVGFENAHVDARGVWFDTCFFYHAAHFRGGPLEFTNSTISAPGNVTFEATTRDIGATSEINENCGRAAVDVTLFPDAGTSDPLFPDICGQGIYGYVGNGGGGKFVIKSPGAFRVWKGFSWEGGVEVVGPGANFTMPSASHSAHLSSATVALWVRNGAQALIDPRNLKFGQGANASTHHLKVGVGAPIQMAGLNYASRSSTIPSLNAADQDTFVDGYTWNGNFSRALEYHTADSGYPYPNADFSAIRDSRVWWVQ